MKKTVHQIINFDPDYPIEMMRIREGEYPEIIFCHWHPLTEIICVISGQLTLEIDQKICHLGPGDFAFINPEEIHYGNNPSGDTCELVVAVLDWGLLGYLESHIFHHQMIAPLEKGDYHLPTVLLKEKYPRLTETLKSLFLRIFSEYQSIDLHHKHMIRILMSEFLLLLYRNDCIKKHRNASPNQKSLDPIKEALRFIDEHHSEKIYIQEIAHKLAISEDYFFKLFKRATGVTPSKYIQQIRITHAKNALIHSTKSISEIGASVGYESTSYFIKQFHLLTGTTPKQYQKLYL